MDKAMKEVHIECAGAGKTYGIAQKIIGMIDDCPDGKKIYAITYTNYTVNQIKSELVRPLKYIPDCVVVSTVHSFFLDNIVYPFSRFIKGEPISSCSTEVLSGKVEWKAKRIKALKDEGIIHASAVPQYAKSILVAAATDKAAIKKRKGIAVDYFISDIYCLLVDEAQDMNDYFFDLMLMIVGKLENYYFVGDPFQALWGADEYKKFAVNFSEQESTTLTTNYISRRIPACVAKLCNRILPESSAIRSISTESGSVDYVFLSELDDKAREKLASSNVFSYIKAKTDVFSTSNDKAGLTHEFLQILNQKYPSYDISALRCAVISRMHEVGLDAYLKQQKIVLSRQNYAQLANQFLSEKETGIFVESIQKIKGLENDSAYFIICNSLLEILLGVKNDFNKETNLLYVALTRTKRRLLFIIDDDEALKNNFQKREIDMSSAMRELGIKKAFVEEWF